MKHKYRGYTYQLRVRHKTELEWIIFKKTWMGKLGWEYISSEDFKQKEDESEQGFVTRVHKLAQSEIDAAADKNDRNNSLSKMVNDNSLEFMGRLTK